MPANVIKNLLERVSPEQRNEINTLLFSYQEDEAGYIMSTDFIELKKQIQYSKRSYKYY